MLTVLANSNLHHQFKLNLSHFREAQGTFAENQKAQTLRQAYQKAVVTPIMSLEQLWKEYNIFENVSS